MKKTTLLFFVVLALGMSPWVVAHELIYTTTFSGLNENPPVPETNGTGSATVTFDTDTLMMRVQADFSDLTGTTTAAHIHCCVAPPGNVGVATVTPSFTNFPLGVTAGTYDFTYDMAQSSSFNASFITNNGGNVSSALQALLNGLDAGHAYFNIHTSFRSGGEIRGFLVPEPTGAVLALLGIAVTVFYRRCRPED